MKHIVNGPTARKGLGDCTGGRSSGNAIHTLICIEDTGIYSDRLLAGLTDRGWQCAVVKTTATKKVAPEHHRKEDRFGAGLLAEYGQPYYLDPATQTGCKAAAAALRRTPAANQGSKCNPEPKTAEASRVGKFRAAGPTMATATTSCITSKLILQNPQCVIL